tara:strand:+ start:1951 stop:2433 length:483 start_codon:yes stop_codon:yes gene_type:complete
MASIGNFENIGVKFASWLYNSATIYELDISSANVWNDVEIDLVNQVDNNLSYDSGIINFTGNGVYIIQYVNTFGGGVDDSFSIRFFNLTLNEEVAGSVLSFTTKGTAYWEVQNMMLVNLSTAYTGSFGKTTHQIVMQARNNIDTSNLKIKSSSLVVIKIV